MAKTLLLGCVLAILGGLLAVALTEVGLRLYGVAGASSRLAIYDFDPELGWTTRSSFSTFRSTLEYGHFNFYDKDGLPTTAAGLHTSRVATPDSIVLFGDSFSESYYLPYEEGFPYRLELALGQTVLNFGVSGYAPDQYLLRARRELPRLTPAEVVVTFFPNNDTVDITRDQYQGFAKPLFSTPRGEPINLPLPKLGGKQEQRSYLQLVADHLALYTFLRPRIRQLFGVAAVQDSSPLCYNAGSMRDSLIYIERIKELLDPIRLTVSYIARREEFTEMGCFEANDQLFLALCQELKLNCLSFSPVAKGTDVSDLFFPVDGHLTAAGASRLAEHLAAEIRRPQ